MAHKIEDHECFDKLVKETGSDATFERVIWIDPDPNVPNIPGTGFRWIISLYKYTPSLAISRERGTFIPNFCPMCGIDFREVKE